MVKINKILVPVDFSDAAANALNYAANFASKFQAQLEIMHAFHVPVGGDATFFVNESMIGNYNQIAKNNLQELISGISALEKLTFSLNVEYGMAGDTLLDRLRSEHFDLIIMGAKGDNNILDRLIGSTTYELMYKANCPVLTIPENVKSVRWDNVALAIDKINIDGFKPWIQFLYQQFRSSFDIVHVAQQIWKEGAKSDSDELQLAFDGIPYRYYDVAGEGIERRLIHFIKNVDADILTVFPRHQSFLKHLFSHSVTKTLLRQLHKPILAFHEK